MPADDPFDDDFFEEDLPVDELRRQMAAGRATVTAPPRSSVSSIVTVATARQVTVEGLSLSPPAGISIVPGGAVITPG